MEEYIRFLMNTDKRNALRIIRIPEDERKKEKEQMGETIAENIPTLKEEAAQIQEAPRKLPSKIDAHSTTPKQYS